MGREWWRYALGLFLVFRIFLYESFATVIFVLWMLLTLFAVSVAAWFGTAAAVTAAIVALLLYRPLQGFLLTRKYLLIRRGDGVEYAPPGEGIEELGFETGKVLRSLTPENVAKTERFDADHLELYSHFFLVDAGAKNLVIPYEWIVAIEPEFPEV
jgi:hypothetical protein